VNTADTLIATSFIGGGQREGRQSSHGGVAPCPPLEPPLSWPWINIVITLVTHVTVFVTSNYIIISG